MEGKDDSSFQEEVVKSRSPYQPWREMFALLEAKVGLDKMLRTYKNVDNLLSEDFHGHSFHYIIDGAKYNCFIERTKRLVIFRIYNYNYLRDEHGCWLAKDIKNESNYLSTYSWVYKRTELKQLYANLNQINLF
jgi:hypothetical protein